MLPLAQLVKFKSNKVRHSVIVDVYQVYVRNVLLFGFGLCVARQFFGENIICHSMRAGISERYIETRCFLNGTMTIGPEETLYHGYYQWIPILLLLLAISLYLPYRVWIRHYGWYLDELAEKDVDHVLRVLQTSRGNYMFRKTFALECFYAVHLILNLYLTDLFFNGIWSTCGLTSAVAKAFPETGSCFFDYVSSGDVTTGKFICLLPLNNVYRRLFAFLLCLSIGLIVLHVIVFLYRIWLMIRFTWIDYWWSLTIARNAAKTWKARLEIDRHWKENVKGNVFANDYPIALTGEEKEDYV